MNITEVSVFIVYLVFMLAIGVWFFFRDKNQTERAYFLGDRKMGAWIAALSAGASDMSAWVLMGLPTSIYALGLGQIWIAVGLALGYSLSWIYEAPRLRTFSIAANDSITIPQYLTNRFLSESKALQLISAAVFLIAYTIYAASSIKACGTLFNTVTGLDTTVAMYLAAIIVISYTFLGGFSAVSWTDFFQGMLVLCAMLIVPIAAASMLEPGASASINTQGYWNPLEKWQDIVSGFGWGLGYFGMPHIIIRFMSIKSQTELKKSAKIGISWTLIILTFAIFVGVIGRMFIGFDEEVNKNSLVFVVMTRRIFPALVSGVLLSAVLAAAMSTADSQLLAAASAFASDVYRPVLRQNKVGNREMLWAGRIVVLVISCVALYIASRPDAGSIMSLVSNAWGVFGAAFGPAIMLSLFWKKFTYTGAALGIFTGAIVDILWLTYYADSGIYEIIPGFAAGLVVAYLAALIFPQKSKQVEELFDKAVEMSKA
ncbi:MAG: sodium/proline symporter [Synergistaceae bacterium]|nr:sodium/proline symporter [Synergistaceae bacterium]